VPKDGYLALVTLRHAGEVVEAADLPKPSGRALDRKERKLAEQLIGALEGEWNPGDYHDEYRERLLDFVKKKAKGKAPKVRKLPKKRGSKKDLSELLAASLRSAEKERRSA
jgi:DNA end-binding protein Ku